jgi:hypothetical protein
LDFSHRWRSICFKDAALLCGFGPAYMDVAAQEAVKS